MIEGCSGEAQCNPFTSMLFYNQTGDSVVFP